MRSSALAVLLLLPALVAAQPQGQVLWGAPGTDGIYSTIAIPDINGDSSPEAVGAIYYGGTPSDARKVWCCSGRTGDSLWLNRTAYGTWGNKDLGACADLDRDGYGDAVLGTVGTYIPPGRCCIALSGLTGENLWTRSFTPPDTWGWVYSVRSFVDLDADSIPDVLVGIGGTTTNPNGHALALSGDSGTVLWHFRAAGDGVQSVAPFADITGDSVPDVLVAAGGNGTDNHVYCVSGSDGSQRWSYLTGGSVSDVKRIADVNGSGCDDCVEGGWDYKVRALEGEDGDSIWMTSLGSGKIVMELVPVRDVDGDGVEDVIVGAWDSNVRVLSGATGATLWAGPVGADVWSVDTLADVTGDGIPEVVAGCLGNGSGVVKLFSGADGTPLWYYNFTERVYDVTGAPDMNGDGRPDVLVGLQDQGHEANHLVCLDGLPPSGVAGPGAGAADGFLLAPFGCGLRLSLPAGLTYRLAVYDAAGLLATPPINGAGTGQVVAMQFPGLGSGSFFARITLGNGATLSRKLIIP